MGGVLPKQSADGVRRLGGRALHQGQIAPAVDNLFPVVLEGPLGGFILGKEQHAGGVPVQPVDDEHPGPGGSRPDIVGHLPVGGAHLFLVAGHGQKPCGLVHHQDVLVLPKNRKGQLPLLPGLRLDGHCLAGDKGMVVAGDGLSVHLHLAPGEQALHGVAALVPHRRQQEGEQGARLLHPVLAGGFWFLMDHMGSHPFPQISAPIIQDEAGGNKSGGRFFRGEDHA